ncbi:MAG: S-methyl-5-thioribose-1-phosphate isomerase [Bdellovibrionales bacterium]|nr:S-methyl-5-thioribose-1-phosphate isomerase [Bdellovibrionales bacterium]
MTFETVTWKNGKVMVLDQKLLPGKTFYHAFDKSEDVAMSIETMIVRGAPAIGVTAALGLALAAHELKSHPLDEAQLLFLKACERFANTRPTAVNLFWAIAKLKNLSQKYFETTVDWCEALYQEAIRIHREDIEICKSLGQHGAPLMPENGNVLTHCNAGALATAGHGTALGVIRSAIAQQKKLHVFADETRPFLQGSRLTAWELLQDNIPVTLITDNMAGHFMAKGEIQAVIVGADRIAANGDTANKIGTYSVAVLANAHDIPFYVAAPLSTIDIQCSNGTQIPIEERKLDEVFEFAGQQIAPKGVHAKNPAFDVTPAKFITAIITEKGVLKAPYEDSIRQVFNSEGAINVR